MLFHSDFCLLVYALFRLSVYRESWLLKSPTMIGLLLLHVFNSYNVLFMKLGAPYVQYCDVSCVNYFLN